MSSRIPGRDGTGRRRTAFGDGPDLQQLKSDTEADINDADRTVAEIISDLQKADTVNGLLAIQAALKKKREILKNCEEQLCLDRSASIQYEELKQLIQDCAPPQRHLLEEWRRETKDSNLVKVWEVARNMQAGTVDVPFQYRLDINPEAREANFVRISVKRRRTGETSDSCSASPGGGSQDVEELEVPAESYTINLDIGPVCVNHITGDVQAEVEEAVENVLLTKIDWAEELARVQELKREKQRLVRQLERQKARGQQQQEARERAEKQLADLYRRHKEEKKKEQERVKNFYMGIVRGKNQHLKGLMEKIGASDSLRDVIQHLFEDFNVRLLGIDSGLRFLMDVPVEEYDDVLRQQDDIRTLLEQKLLPDQKAEWTHVTSCELPSDETDLQLGQPLPVPAQSQVSDDAGAAKDENDLTKDSVSGGASFDPMTATPRRVFVTDMAADGDTGSEGPFITAIIATQAGRLVMADYNKKMVKVADVTNPDTVRGVQLHDKPWALAVLQDGLVAVTSSSSKIIRLVDVSSHPLVVSRVQTARRYLGVSAGTTDDTLIVSCWTDDDGLASVDVIKRSGDVIQRVIDSNTLRALSSPGYLRVEDGDVIISDRANEVYRVELDTGQVVATLTHSEAKCPLQVCVDQSGNVYIACSGSKCVLVMSADGQWRPLLEGSQHGDKGCVRPYGVCVTGSHIIVSWAEPGHTVVTCYNMK